MLKLGSIFKRARPHPPQPAIRRWTDEPGEAPWFDKPNAMELLEQRREREGLDDAQVAMLRQYVEDGYCVIKDVVDEADIDGMLSDMDALWTADTPDPRIEVLGAQLTPDDAAVLPHAELLGLPRERREALRDRAPWRLHGSYNFSAAARRIYENQAILDATSLIFGIESKRDSTINFTFGSRQGLHQDTAVFALYPQAYLIGAWLACEDIHKDAGPLVYYPGSHREPMFAEFDNYPQTGLKTCDADTSARYYTWLGEVSARHERKQFLAKKGEILLWHGMLIHGGDELIDSGRTRKSWVCHFIPDGKNKADQIVGPFNW